jgi:hypothetical protein
VTVPAMLTRSDRVELPVCRLAGAVPAPRPGTEGDMRKLTPGEFADALGKGLGRAVLHVRDHGSDGLEEVLANALLHEERWDRQAEDGHAPYLYEVVNATGRKNLYATRILSGALDSGDEADVGQLLQLTRLLAQDGWPNARETLYARFDRGDLADRSIGADEIVRLDGLDGLRHVAAKLGPEYETPDEERDWIPHYLCGIASERIGDPAVAAALSASDHPSVRLFWQAAERQRAADAVREVQPCPLHSAEELIAAVEQLDDAGSAHLWGERSFVRTASDEQIEAIFAALVRERRRPQLLAYLRLFHFRAVPRLDPRLFELARSTDDVIQTRTVHALAKVRDPAVRELAIGLLRTGPRAVRNGAIALLIRNYEAGDHRLIEEALPGLGTPWERHSAALDLDKVAQASGDHLLVPALDWAYENTPCGNCRGCIVKRLMTMGRLTPERIEECRFDSDEFTRSLVAERG